MPAFPGDAACSDDSMGALIIGGISSTGGLFVAQADRLISSSAAPPIGASLKRVGKRCERSSAQLEALRLSMSFLFAMKLLLGENLFPLFPCKL